MNSENTNKFRKATKDDNATFFFIPSEKLQELVSIGGDPIIDKLPSHITEAILTCGRHSGIILDPELIIKHLDGTIDKHNAYLLSYGEVRVIGVGDMVIYPNKPIDL